MLALDAKPEPTALHDADRNVCPTALSEGEVQCPAHWVVLACRGWEGGACKGLLHGG